MINDTKPLIKSKFIYLWVSQVLSQLTINMMNFLLLFKLFSETSSTIATSLLWVSYALPAIIIGPIAAAAIDVWDKRKVLVLTNLFQALTILIYALTYQKQIFLPYGVAMAYSVFNQFYLPAEAASVPSLVKTEDLPRANGLFFMTQQVALILGFGLAGPLEHFLGFRSAFLLCSLIVFIAFVSVLFLPAIKAVKQKAVGLESAVVKFFADIFDGYRFIKSNRSILFPLLLLIVVQVILTLVTVNVPTIAQDIIKISTNTAGLLVVVPAGVGSAIGAVLIPVLIKRGMRKIKIIKDSLAIFAFTLLTLIFLTPNLELVLRIVSGFVLIMIIGIAFIGILIPSQTFLQEKTPGGMRGRVFGNFWFITTVITVFPVILGGTITEYFGIRLLFLLLSLAVIIGLAFIQKINLSLSNQND